MTQFWADLKTFFWVRYFNAKDLATTVVRYWKMPKFALVDLTLLLSYFFKSPYRIAREYNPDEPYGETPLATLETILADCPVEKGGLVIELGSGRGRACFWLAVYKGYNTLGIEYIPSFVTKAQKIASFFGIKNVRFCCEDILQCDLSQASVIYLFGTALPDETIKALCKKFEYLKPGTRIITVSYPLRHYTESKKIVLEKTLEAQFAWGPTEVYINLIDRSCP